MGFFVYKFKIYYNNKSWFSATCCGHNSWFRFVFYCHFLGILAGVIVWGVLFLPMHYYVIQPALSSMANAGSLDSSVANQLIELSDTIIVGSLALHMLFGGVMGFCSRLAAI
jgi:uncharacterized membrane protein YqhA